MSTHPLGRRVLAEFLGTGLLVAVAVGSAIAAGRLSPDPGVQLLASAVATAMGLGVLIVLLTPVSGAHLNPVVTLALTALEGRSPAGMLKRELVAYASAQIAGGIGGALLANTMFAVPTSLSTTDRATPATFLAEAVATAGLVLVIAGLSRAGRPVTVIATAVGCYIGAAYWFTSSTSFANPAVTIARMLTETPAGIAPASVLPWLLAQLLGGAIAVGLTMVLFPAPHPAAGLPPTPQSW